MPNPHKPRIGLLALMLREYEESFPGVTERQTAYAKALATDMAASADCEVVFEAPAFERASIEEAVKNYNSKDLDGILIVMLTYNCGAWLVRALQDNRLPLAMAVVQPEDTVGDDWEELDFTVNQGLHGAQDNANAIVRSGIPCQFFAGSRREPRFADFVRDFARACRTRKRLLRMQTGVVAVMPGMNDISHDSFALLRQIGPELRHDSLGGLAVRMAAVTQAEIDAQIALDKETFDVAPGLSHADHGEAVRMYLAFRKYMEDRQLDALTTHYGVFAEDGRFRQLPLYAASGLMKDGYGYAAEGDAVCACLVAAAHSIGDNDGGFTEMYAMDHARDAIVFCHAGEGNFGIARRDVQPRLIDKVFVEGGLGNPPTPVFTPEPGPATVVSLADMGGGRFRLLCSVGEILNKHDLTRCEMPYFFFRPRTGIVPCVEKWLALGGSHHEAFQPGNMVARWKMLCDMAGIEFVEV
jgi:L-arabinose isomerase